QNRRGRGEFLVQKCILSLFCGFCFFFQAEDGIRDGHVTGVQTCALPILRDHGAVVADIPNRALTDDAPVYRRPMSEPAYIKDARSEERRVGKECKLGMWKEQLKIKMSINGKSSFESADGRYKKGCKIVRT